MNTYIKINSINYPAEIYGHVRDRDWDNRESEVIILIRGADRTGGVMWRKL